jgi:hypothetical protein
MYDLPVNQKDTVGRGVQEVFDYVHIIRKDPDGGHRPPEPSTT